MHFFGLDEMHAIAHSIGKYIYELIAVNLSTSISAFTNIYYIDNKSNPNIGTYTFKFPPSDVRFMGEYIEISGP